MDKLQSLPVDLWHPQLNHDLCQVAIQALEKGQVLFFPKLAFEVLEEEKQLFSPHLVKKDRKNLSYSLSSDEMKGYGGPQEEKERIHEMMKRFAEHAKEFMDTLLPSYQEHLLIGRTSFRPVEVEGRTNASFRKDDTLLHLDSFPSSPTGGKRILRFFANVNPLGQPRTWKVGEPFESVLKRYLPRIKKPLIGSRFLLNRLGITKSYRILYDHYMLKVHHSMKADSRYQKEVEQEMIQFPSSTCWMCFTDQVSHAALSGQYVFEQSFYLPIEGQKYPEHSPLHYMEKLFQKRLRN